jgi:hypothetical protein
VCYLIRDYDWLQVIGYFDSVWGVIIYCLEGFEHRFSKKASPASSTIEDFEAALGFDAIDFYYSWPFSCRLDKVSISHSKFLVWCHPVMQLMLDLMEYGCAHNSNHCAIIKQGLNSD